VVGLGATLKETPPSPPLCAADDFAAIDHQFIGGGGKKTGGIDAVVQHIGFSGIRSKFRRDSEIVVSEAKSLGYPPVVPVDCIAEIEGIVRNHGVGEFVIVQHCTAAGRPVNDVDTICPAIVHVHSFLDLLIAS